MTGGSACAPPFYRTLLPPPPLPPPSPPPPPHTHTVSLSQQGSNRQTPASGQLSTPTASTCRLPVDPWGPRRSGPAPCMTPWRRRPCFGASHGSQLTLCCLTHGEPLQVHRHRSRNAADDLICLCAVAASLLRPEEGRLEEQPGSSTLPHHTLIEPSRTHETLRTFERLK